MTAQNSIKKRFHTERTVIHGIIMKTTVFFIKLLFILQINLSAQNLFNKENSLIFTHYLFKTHQYDFASTELEKLVFFNTSDDSLKFLLLKSYRLSESYLKGINRAEMLYKNTGTMPTYPAQEYVKLLLSADKYPDARHFLNENKNLMSVDYIKFGIHLNLLEKNWEEANTIYQKNKDTHQGIEIYKPVVFQGMNMKHKSPFLAGSLSTIVPGLGKVYTGWWKDGLLSFLSIGLSSWQAYKGFKTDGTKSAYGWVFGSVVTVLYLSNIYGSQKSAKRYNYNNEKDIIHKVKYHLDTF